MATARDEDTAALVVDSLRNNTSSRLRLELSLEADMMEIQAALNVNTSSQQAEVIFHASFSERTQQEQELITLIHSISRLPNLHQVTFQSHSDDEQLSYFTMPIRALVTVLDLAGALQSMQLGDIQLSGNADDFIALETSIHNHASLQEFSSTGWLSEDTRVAIAASVDPIIRAIASSRSLEYLNMQPSFFGGDVSSVTAGMMCSLPKLQTIHLSNCHLPEEAMVAVATALQHNRVLRELQITCRLEEAGSLAVAQCLRENQALELLNIHNTYTNVHIDTTNIDINETKSGSSGDAADDSDETTVEDDHYIPIAKALQQDNQSLQRLTLHGTRMCKASQDTFANETMRDNFALVDVSLLGLSESAKAKIGMFTLLNRCGRQKLMQGGGAERRQWIVTMAQVANQIDCLFYLLSTKPSLCDLQNMYDDPSSKRRLTGREMHDTPKKRPRSS